MHRKKAFIITLLFGLNATLGVLSQVFIARFFGTTLALDNFLIAVTLPTLLITIFYGTVNDAFLPTYIKTRETNTKQASLFAGHWFKQIVFLSFLFFTLSLVFPRFILNLFLENPNEQVTLYYRILALTFLFALPNSLLMSIAYAKERYYFPAFLQLLGAFINFMAILLLSPWLNAYSLVIGFIGNILFQFIFLTPFFKEINLRGKFFLDYKIYSLWLPLVGMSFLFRLDNLILRTASAGLGVGAVSIVNYAAKVFSMSAGIITSGIKALFLPILTTRLAKNDKQHFKLAIKKSLLLGLSLSLITAFGIYLLRVPLVNLLFVRGSFTQKDAQAVLALMPYFVPAAIGWGIFQLTAIPYFSVNKNHIPFYVSVIGAILAYGFLIFTKHIFLIRTAPIAISMMLLFDSMVLVGYWYIKEPTYLKSKHED